MTVIEQRFMEAVTSASRALSAPKQINWEQRRYELVKDLYAARLQQNSGKADGALLADSIRDADKIISVLKG